MKKTLEQKIEFANSIDFSGLFSHAEGLAGFELTFEKPEVRERYENVTISFKSNDISPTCGIFSRILEYCVIEKFNSEVFEDKETGELKYWATVYVSYQHHEGGSNGMQLFTAWYSNGEWTFRDVEPRKPFSIY